MARYIGIRVEGIGFDTGKSAGVVFCEHTSPPTTGSYEWVSAMVGGPGALTTKIDPFKGTWTAPSLTVKLDRSSRIARALLATPATTAYALSSAHTAVATTVFFVDATGLSPGDVVYVGDEAILLGPVNTITSFSGCTRAFWGTGAQTHLAAGAVFTRNPYLKRRVVSAISRVGGVEKVRWSGLIKNVKQQGAHVIISVDSLLQGINRARLNDGAYNYRRNANLSSVFASWSARTDDRVRRGDALAGGYIEAFQVGENFCVFVLQSADAPPTHPFPIEPRRRGVAMGPSATFFDIDPQVVADADVIYRVLCIDRDVDTITGFGHSATADLPTPFHPVAITLALLTSTGTGDNGAHDVLGARWGLGLRFIDVASFTDAINESLWLEIDRLILGWDGEEVALMSVIREKLLRPYGYTLAVNNLGEFSLVKLRMPDLTQRAAVNALPVSAYPEPHPTQDLQLTSRARVLKLKVGGEPYGKGEIVTVTMSDRSTRAGRLDDVPAITLDMSTVKPERLIGGGGLTEFIQAIIQTIAVGLDSPPILKIRTASYLDTGLDISVGDTVAVQDLGITGDWWLTGDGVETRIVPGSVQGAGLVVGISPPFHGANMDVEMMMLGHRLPDYIHLIAPSALIASWDAFSTAATVNATKFTGTDDAATFEVGDELELWTSKAALKGTLTPSITLIAGAVITMSGGFGVAPVAGDYLRVSRSTTYSSAAHIAGEPRPWAYAAQNAAQDFEDATTTVTYDVWGTELFIGSESAVAKDSVPGFSTLDDEIIEALSSTEAWPIDALLQQTMQGNEAWLLTRDLPAGQLLNTHHGDDLLSTSLIRPFCSAKEAVVQIVPVMLQTGWMGARCATIARVANEYANNFEETGVSLRLDLYGMDWRRIKKGDDLVFYETVSDTPDWQPIEIDLALDAPISTATAGYLVLWITSRTSPLPAEAQDTVLPVSFGTGTPTTDNQYISLIVASAETFLDDTAATRPNLADFAVSAFALQRWSGSAAGGFAFSDDLVDPLWRRSDGTETELIIGPDPVGGGGGYVNAIDRYALTYAQFRAYEWSIFYADLGRSPTDLMRPLAPALGEVAGGHVTRTMRAFTNPRLAHVGPAGDVQDPYSGAPGYSQRWPRETHDNATATHIEAEALFIPTRKNPKLIIMGLVMPTLCVPNFADLLPEDPLGADWVTRATWAIDADLYQTGVGGWTGPANEQQEFEFLHWYTHASQQGILTSELAQFSGNFPYREGSPYLKDIKYLQPFVLSLGEVAYDPNTDDAFVRVRLRVDGTGTPTYTKETNVAYQTRDRVQLALAAWSIFEVA